MKFMLNLIGCLAVALAVLGVFLPLLPTTPFLLLASACFMRSSTRMHRWLMNNRLFGEYLRNIEGGKGMPMRAKLIALALMWPSLAYSMYLLRSPAPIALLAACGIAVTVYILRMKTLGGERGDGDA